MSRCRSTTPSPPATSLSSETTINPPSGLPSPDTPVSGVSTPNSAPPSTSPPSANPAGPHPSVHAALAAMQAGSLSIDQVSLIYF